MHTVRGMPTIGVISCSCQYRGRAGGDASAEAPMLGWVKSAKMHR